MRLCSTCLVGVAALAACRGEAVPRPHVVLIVIDTLRADVMLGGGLEHPNVAALAQDGVVFPDAFTHAPLTLPSHTSVFSSRLPAETGVLANGQRVPEHVPLVAEWLAQHGYATRAVVSMGTLSPPGAGLKRGFEVFDADFYGMADGADTAERLRAVLADWSQEERLFLFAHFSDPHSPYRAHGGEVKEARVRMDGEELAAIDPSEAAPLTTTLALAPGTHELEIESDEPFRVLSLRLRKPREIPPTWLEGRLGGTQKRARVAFETSTDAEHHLTLWVCDVADQPTKRARYLREAAHADRFVGELVRELKDLGIYDESLILLHSDHGESLGEHGFFGHASVLSDSTLRVPLVVKPPEGHPRAGSLARRAREMASLVDVTPTILAFCGVPPLPGQRGTALTEERAGREHVAQTHTPDSKQDKVCIRDKRYKMVYVRDTDAFEMYDMVADPHEVADVFPERSSARPDWAERLRAIAAAAEAARQDGPVDEASRELLEALGYAGGED